MKAAVFPLLFLLLIQACKPDSDTPCRAVNVAMQDFTSAELALWPYNGNDSLRFVTASFDSILLTVDSNLSFYNGVAYTVNPECPPDSNGFPGIQRIMSDSLFRLNFIYTIRRIDSTIWLDANGSTLTFHFSDIGSDSAAGFRDSVALGGRIFYNVHLFSNAQGDSFYYNSSDGLLRIKNGSGEFTLYQRN